MLVRTQENEEIIERVAALDIGKAGLVVLHPGTRCGYPGRRLQEVDTYPTMTRALRVMADRMSGLGITRVVMEATSDYWKPVFCLLEAAGFETWLVNAKDVKHLPGGPKTASSMRCGCARSRSGRCSGPVSCRRRSCAGSGT